MARISQEGIEVSEVILPIRGFRLAKNTRTEMRTVVALSGIPFDNTPPLSNEGTNVFSYTFSPSIIGQKLEMKGVIFIGAPTTAWITAAIFKNSENEAMQCWPAFISVNGAMLPFPIDFEFIATSLTPVIFNIRAGAHTGTAKLNGVANDLSTLQGGSLASVITVKEYLPEGK